MPTNTVLTLQAMYQVVLTFKFYYLRNTLHKAIVFIDRHYIFYNSTQRALLPTKTDATVPLCLDMQYRATTSSVEMLRKRVKYKGRKQKITCNSQLRVNQFEHMDII